MTTLRLPAETEALVERIAKRTGRSKSRVIRDAIALLAAREAGDGSSRPYDAVAHLIGIGDSGGQLLSKHTGKRFTQMLQDKRASKQRRAR